MDGGRITVSGLVSSLPERPVPEAVLVRISEQNDWLDGLTPIVTTEDSLATSVHGFVIDIDGEPHGLQFANGHWNVVATDGERTELAEAVERAAETTPD